jgi:succinate dehydrogenase / fumarate reductase cytochrome b subunit
MVKTLFRSPIGKKIVTGVTGLALVLFVTIHMLGNLSMFAGDDAYNVYAHTLMSLGPLLYLVEAGLALFFLLHIVSGINIWIGKRRARPQNYAMYRSAGGPSRQTASSRSMAITGIILFAFLIFHLVSFKFGPGGPGNANAAYVTEVDGIVMRDLSLLVRERFALGWYTFGYTALMLLMAVHLRHGIWSAFQSLGAMKPSISGVVYGIGAVYGLLVAIGFVVMPLALYFEVI